MESYSNLCRLCLDHDNYGVDLFKGRNSQKYSEQLKDVFLIELRDIPGWPVTACSNCIEKIIDFTIFKTIVTSSQEKLFQLLSSDIQIKCEPVDFKRSWEESLRPIDNGEDLAELDKTESTSEVKEDVLIDFVGADEDDKESITTISDGNQEDNHTDLPVKRPARNRRKTKFIRGTLIAEDMTVDKMLRDRDLLKCSLCPMKFTSYSGLSKHQQNVHKRCGSISCCGFSFWARVEVYDHMKYHLDPEAFKCQDCGKLCMCDRQLLRHRKAVHPPRATRMKKFKCETCGKLCKNEAALKMHSKAHIAPEKRPIKCPQCDKRFHFDCSLKSHIESAHTLIKLKSECDICGKMVVHLDVHMRRKHASSENTKQCRICKKMIPAVAMTQHMTRTHNKECYPCSTCQRSFKTKAYLKVHVDKEHEGVRYHCSYCSHRSRCRGDLWRHHKSLHPVEFARDLEAKKLAAKEGITIKVEREDASEGEVSGE